MQKPIPAHSIYAAPFTPRTAQPEAPAANIPPRTLNLSAPEFHPPGSPSSRTVSPAPTQPQPRVPQNDQLNPSLFPELLSRLPFIASSDNATRLVNQLYIANNIVKASAFLTERNLLVSITLLSALFQLLIIPKTETSSRLALYNFIHLIVSSTTTLDEDNVANVTSHLYPLYCEVEKDPMLRIRILDTLLLIAQSPKIPANTFLNIYSFFTQTSQNDPALLPYLEKLNSALTVVFLNELLKNPTPQNLFRSFLEPFLDKNTPSDLRSASFLKLKKFITNPDYQTNILPCFVIPLILSVIQIPNLCPERPFRAFLLLEVFITHAYGQNSPLTLLAEDILHALCAAPESVRKSIEEQHKYPELYYTYITCLLQLSKPIIPQNPTHTTAIQILQTAAQHSDNERVRQKTAQYLSILHDQQILTPLAPHY